MFCFMTDFKVVNYADDSASFRDKVGGKSDFTLLFSSLILFTWLRNNYINGNTSKSDLLLSGNYKATVNIDGSIIESEDNQVLLGIIIDSNLSSNSSILKICVKKVSAKLRVLGFMNFPKPSMIMKSFVTSQFLNLFLVH